MATTVDNKLILETATKPGGVSLRALQVRCCSGVNVTGYSAELRNSVEHLEALGLIKRYLNGLYSTTKEGQAALKNNSVPKADEATSPTVQVATHGAAPARAKSKPKAKLVAKKPANHVKTDLPEKAAPESELQGQRDTGESITVPLVNTSSELKKMSVDQLLVLFNIGAEAQSIIETRLRAFGFSSASDTSKAAE